MGRKQNRRELRAAREGDEVVGLIRNVWRADRIGGYVAGVERDWVLLHVVDEVVLDGWSAVRADTIGKVVRQSPDSFVSRALQLYEQEPGLPGPVDLEGPASIVRSFARTHPLVTIHTETLDPTVCTIGWPVELTKKHLTLFEISPRATWDDEPSRLRLDTITRIEVGGRYERALHQLGGYPPIP